MYGFVQWIRACLESASISVLVNGSPTNEFLMERGVRQGDPLSPFLFILATEGLNVMLKEAVNRNIFRGIKVGANDVKISHLQYADDTIFFGEWSRNNASKLMTNMRRLGAWRPVIEKFKKRLSGWKAKSMSFGGRLTLVKSVLGSLPLYHFSMFRVPSCVINALESIRRNFFGVGWGKIKKMRWVKWDNIIASYGSGGLNIGSLKAKNLALLGKWWWRFMVEGKESLWGKVIRCIHGSNGGLDSDLGLGSRVRRLWEMGKTRYFGMTYGLREWNWVRNPRGRMEGEMIELNNILTNVSVYQDCRDKWKYDEDGGVKVKMLTTMIEEYTINIGNNNQATLWNKLLPKKVNTFIRRALKCRLPVRVELDKRGIDLHTILCPWCDNHQEIVDHGLVLCDEVQKVWDKVFQWWSLEE
ncbi:reverse transcriptase domain, reverse transcriptase zinc-binding domain protein [Tanacetum coccineum]